MKIDMQALHWVTLALGAAASSATILSHSLPPSAEPWIRGGAGICAFGAAVLGVFFTGKAIQPSELVEHAPSDAERPTNPNGGK